MVSTTLRTYAASDSNVRSGLGGAIVWWPLAWSWRITWSNPEASANDPCRRTIVGRDVAGMAGSFDGW